LFRTLLGSIVVGAIAAVGCSSGGPGTTVGVAMTDTSITVAAPSAPAGSITFEPKNDGTETHELYVFQTDLPADQLPVAEGKVPESADGVTFIAEVEDIAPATTGTLTVSLSAGNYVLLCNTVDHYTDGMRAPFTVT